MTAPVDLEAIRERVDRYEIMTDAEVIFDEAKYYQAYAVKAHHLALDVPTLLAEVERLRTHSTILNTITWKIATALGDVPSDADQITGNPEFQADRLIAELAEAKRESDRVWALLTGARESVRRLTSILIANASRLDVPFRNADGSPWSLHVKPAIDRLQASLGMRGAWPVASQVEDAEGEAVDGG